ncbi:hypothetical protein [Streptococcus mitis]|uniref:hypothetical protein n=1 Tax=Streptococcus mitis TaxID=28037 RepID=UPI0039C415B4
MEFLEILALARDLELEKSHKDEWILRNFLKSKPLKYLSETNEPFLKEFDEIRQAYASGLERLSDHISSSIGVDVNSKLGDLTGEQAFNFIRRLEYEYSRPVFDFKICYPELMEEAKDNKYELEDYELSVALPEKYKARLREILSLYEQELLNLANEFAEDFKNHSVKIETSEVSQ